MSSSPQSEKEFKKNSACLGEGSSCSHTCTVLINDRQWLYIQRRYRMSPRELQIAKLICQGFRNDDIASDLHITLGTVKTHVRNIYRRVQVKSKISMLLRLVSDAREFFAQYDEITPIPAVDLANTARIISTH